MFCPDMTSEVEFTRIGEEVLGSIRAVVRDEKPNWVLAHFGSTSFCRFGGTCPPEDLLSGVGCGDMCRAATCSACWPMLRMLSPTAP